MQFIIDKCSQEDFGDLQKLFLDMFKNFPVDQNINYPTTDQGIAYLNERIKNGISFSAKYNQQLVGFIFGSIQKAIPFKTYDKFGFIENLMVNKEFQHQEIGSKLIESFSNECKKMGVNVIQTDSDFTQSLVNFYTKNNFKISSINYIMKI